MKVQLWGPTFGQHLSNVRRESRAVPCSDLHQSKTTLVAKTSPRR